MFYKKDLLIESLQSFKNNDPFDYCVIDNFLEFDIASALENEFLEYDDQRWFYYKNSIENKKALNDWNIFPSLTYQVFKELISKDFTEILSTNIGVPLYQDPGLHGGGWHIHGAGGNLNPHFDYSIHPKLGLQRKINIIIYLSSTLKKEDGGYLGLWSHDESSNKPNKLIAEIEPKFNRAVIFDTTQKSWHGMSRPLSQPEGVYRKSLAIYYLTDAPGDADPRQRALFAPREEQKNDINVLNLIQRRSDPDLYSSAYREN
jgi:Rps23 Pro-64 3,4-dihydroxylase Tpa1-like proline 4-hydroxylase